MMEKSLLFFGDLAPKYLSGTSISAKINLDILQETFHVFHIEEGDNWKEHQTSSFNKVKRNIHHAYAVLKLSRKQDIDVFYSHLPSSFAGILKIIILCISARLGGVQKNILHLHRGDYFHNYQQSKGIRFLHRILLRVCDEIISLSPEHKTSLKTIITPEKIEVVENTIEQEVTLPKKDGSSVSLDFICISNYIEEKGILDLLYVFEEILKDHEGISLFLYGNSFQEDLTMRIREKHDGKTIFINDAVNGKEKFEVLKRADCFILPSWNEGQPLVILEAMSQGIPIIASRVGFVPEMLGKNYPYLFEARNLKDLKENILDFIEHQPTYLGTQLFERYQMEFSQIAHRKKILKVFNSL